MSAPGQATCSQQALQSHEETYQVNAAKVNYLDDGKPSHQLAVGNFVLVWTLQKRRALFTVNYTAACLVGSGSKGHVWRPTAAP